MRKCDDAIMRRHGRGRGHGHGRGRMNDWYSRGTEWNPKPVKIEAAGPSSFSSDDRSNPPQTDDVSAGSGNSSGSSSGPTGRYPPRPHVESSLCVGCAMCMRVCPVGAITMDGPIAVINPETCAGCGICIRACPRGAISFGS